MLHGEDVHKDAPYELAELVDQGGNGGTVRALAAQKGHEAGVGFVGPFDLPLRKNALGVGEEDGLEVVVWVGRWIARFHRWRTIRRERNRRIELR